MILAMASIPGGVSADIKEKFMCGINNIFCRAFNCTPEAVTVYLYIQAREDVCIDAWEKLSMTVYYSVDNKTEAKRYQCGLMFDTLCTECFGEACPPAFIIFKEHRNDNFCWQGNLVMFDHDYIAPYTDGTR